MRYLLIFLCCIWSALSYGQSHVDQNGWNSSVTNALAANGTQALRFEVANLGYNSHHWQPGGLIIIELFNISFSTGYEKYIVDNGFGRGINTGSPQLSLVESYGIDHFARVVLGTPYDQSSSYGGYINKVLPIFVEAKNYAVYKVKITYMQSKVDQITDLNQIKVNIAPTGTPTADFNATTILEYPLRSSKNLMITGDGSNHYIQTGNVGIGTTTPNEKLSVNGNIRAKEIKVEAANWPDYVFDKAYKLRSLLETEKHIREKGHLPGVPSAAEAMANGVELGEMNKKLLEKIEELTLHLIELNKQVQRQEQKLNSLNSSSPL